MSCLQSEPDLIGCLAGRDQSQADCHEVNQCLIMHTAEKKIVNDDEGRSEEKSVGEKLKLRVEPGAGDPKEVCHPMHEGVVIKIRARDTPSGTPLDGNEDLKNSPRLVSESATRGHTDRKGFVISTRSPGRPSQLISPTRPTTTLRLTSTPTIAERTAPIA